MMLMAMSLSWRSFQSMETAADQIFPQLLSLPLYPGLSDSDVDRVCEALAGLAARTA